MLLATLLMGVFYLSEAKPSIEWSQQNQAKFDQLDVGHFDVSVAHHLHSLTIESTKLVFNINLPIDNGIPTLNTNISEPEKIVPNIPSRPTGMVSAAMNTFVDVMSHLNDANWMYQGSGANKLLHGMHMINSWARAKATADSFHDVHDDICLAALDTENNGVTEALKGPISNRMNQRGYPSKSLDCETNVTLLQIAMSHPLTLDDNGESWNFWKHEALVDPSLCYKEIRSMGLFIHCLGRKFPNKENPVEVCCDSKTVGQYTYTKVSTGAVPGNCLNNCIYRRNDKPSSKYCFAIGEEEVHCIKEG